MINNAEYISEFRRKVLDTINGKGDIILLEGEQGFGKSHIISKFAKICNEDETRILNIIIENEDADDSESSQIFKPLLPVEKALEAILKAKNLSAKKKLAVDMTLTSLSMIPIFGDFIYGVKELSRDWRRYKDGKSGEDQSKGKSAEYLDAFKAKALKEPYVLFFEDMHSADSASERFLQMLASNISELPILIVISYNPSRVAVSGDTMFALREEYQHKIWKLEALSNSEINELCKRKIDNYSTNEEFVNWFSRVTSGIPSEIIEFLDYFKINPPFNENGNLQIDLTDSKLPSNAGSAFKETLKDLKNDELDLLLCGSSIGRDFSVSLLSELIGKSPIQVTRMVRDINQKTDCIRSLGAFENLGVKSTVYRFNENTFFRYLREMLEFEEIFELNTRISEILKLRLNATEDEDIKEEIAAKLLRHSRETEDEQNIDLALNQIKNYAKSNNDEDLKKIINSKFGDNKEEQIIQSDNDNSLGNINIDFFGMRNLLTNNFNNSAFPEVLEISRDYLQKEEKNLSRIQKAIIYLLQARAEIELKNFENASALIRNAITLSKDSESEHLDCLILNTKAILHFYQNHTKRSINLLQKAAEIALNLPGELRILTLANIAKILKSKNDPDAEIYLKTAKRMQEEFAFNGLV